MYKTVLYSFAPGEIPGSSFSPIIEIRSICSKDLPDDLDTIKGDSPEAQTIAVRGAKALRRIESNAFTAVEMATLRELAAYIAEKRGDEIEVLRVEREAIAKDEMSRKAYDGLINALEDAIGRLKRQTEFVVGEFESLLDTAEPDYRRP